MAEQTPIPARASGAARRSQPADQAQPEKADQVEPAAVAPVTPAEAAPAPSTTQGLPAGGFLADDVHLLFGMIVVVVGFVAILIGLWIVVANFHTASDATAILGIITTAIAGLGGAFFGVAIGQQGVATANRERAAAEASRDEAQMRTIRFAANMDPEVGSRLVD